VNKIAKTKNKNNSMMLYIIAVLAIVAIIIMAVMMNKPRVLSDEEIAEQAMKINPIKPVIVEPEDNETIATAAGCWCQGKTFEYWTTDCPCPAQYAPTVKDELQ
jgi:flagellar basal body-associated protein FliL